MPTSTWRARHPFAGTSSLTPTSQLSCSSTASAHCTPMTVLSGNSSLYPCETLFPELAAVGLQLALSLRDARLGIGVRSGAKTAVFGGDSVHRSGALGGIRSPDPAIRS